MVIHSSFHNATSESGPEIITKTIGSGGDYTTIEDWFDAYVDTNLITRDIILKGVLLDANYNIYSEQFNLNPPTNADSSHYYWLVGDGSSKLNLSGNSYDGMLGGNCDVRIEGVEFDGNDYDIDFPSIDLVNISSGRHYFEIKNCYFHDIDVDYHYGEGTGAFGISIANGTATVYNNIIYNVGPNDHEMSRVLKAITINSHNANIYNNTISTIGSGTYNMYTYGIFIDNDYSPAGIILRNNIVLDCNAMDGYDTLCYYYDGVTPIASNNGSEDETAPGSSSLTSLGSVLVNPAGGNFNLGVGSNPIDAGYNLGSFYAIDFAGNTRGSYGPWDMGALECTTP